MLRRSARANGDFVGTLSGGRAQGSSACTVPQAVRATHRALVCGCRGGGRLENGEGWEGRAGAAVGGRARAVGRVRVRQGSVEPGEHGERRTTWPESYGAPAPLRCCVVSAPGGRGEEISWFMSTCGKGPMGEWQTYWAVSGSPHMGCHSPGRPCHR